MHGPKRRCLGAASAVLQLALLAGCSGGSAPPASPPPAQRLGDRVALPDDPPRQFDFWLGEWDVVNLRAGRSGAFSDQGHAVARINGVADGNAVLEQWDGTLGGNPLIGFSLRAYDPSLGRWAVWLNWTGDRPDGFSEMHGQKNGERMELFPPGDDAHLRYSFVEAHTESCQWQQGQSKDGQTWVTDWVMQFTRRGRPLAVDADNAPIVQPPASAAAFPETRELDFLLGAWEGTATAVGPDGAPTEGTVRARVTSMIQGFGLLQFLDTSWGEKNIAALGWDRGADGWVALRTDNHGSGIARMVGDLQPDGIRFRAPGGRLRERWSCPENDACSWTRQTSADGGATWVTTVDARMTRSSSTAAWIEIRNARAPFEQVLTGGQPTAEQLEWAAQNGYRTVINLRGPGESGELSDEASLVADLGMRYFAIPMAGAEDLNAENASKLAQALNGEDALPAIVHCASGNRVGALFGLKAHVVDGLSAEAAVSIAEQAGITRMAPALRERLTRTK